VTSPSTRADLLGLLAPVVEGVGLDLEDVELTPAGKRRQLRVTVDCDEGVSLDAVAQVSSAVSAALDDSDVMGGLPYVLEVSSPGVDRPLTVPRHWRRALTRLVEVALADGSTVTGRVTDVHGDGVRLETSRGTRTVGFGEVFRGRVQVEFNRPGPGYGDERAGEDEEV
jgi:ribosome maturation factor RimP